MQPAKTMRWGKQARPVLGLVVLLGVLAAASGCEESVDPIIGTELPFTLWGFMNTGADTQFVRVFPIRDQLIPEQGGGIDARVFSTDLTTGDQREWTYEAVQFDSLIEGHLFWAPFRAEHEHRYRLEVVRSDDATSRVTVTVPAVVDFQIEVTQGSTIIPVRIIGDVPHLVGLRVTYHAVNIPPQLAWPPGTSIAGAVQYPVTILYENVVEKVDDGWVTEIDMVRDFIAVREVYRLNCLITDDRGSAPDVWLRQMEFSALAADSSWAPPGGSFEPNIISVPGTFSNVENGYGFFGAGQGIRYEWSPDQTVSLLAGYNFEPRCQGLFPRPEPECMEPPVPCINESIRDLWRIWLR